MVDPLKKDTQAGDGQRPIPMLRRSGIRFTAIAGAVGLAIGIAAPVVTMLVIRGRTGQTGGPPILPIIIAVVLGILAVVLVASRIARRMMAPATQQLRLLEHGRPAQATIIRLEDTGLTFYRNPQVRFELDVGGPDGRTYRAVAVTVVQRLHASRYQPGMVVKVMVDPLDPAQVTLVDTAPVPVAATGPDGSA